MVISVILVMLASVLRAVHVDKSIDYDEWLIKLGDPATRWVVFQYGSLVLRRQPTAWVGDWWRASNSITVRPLHLSSIIGLLIVKQPTHRPTNPTTDGPSDPATHIPKQHHRVIEELDHLISEHVLGTTTPTIQCRQPTVNWWSTWGIEQPQACQIEEVGTWINKLLLL